MPSSPAPAAAAASCSCSPHLLFLAPPCRLASSRFPFMLRPSPLPHARFLSLPLLAPKFPRAFHATVCLQAVQELPPKLAHIVQLFQLVPEPRAKYEQLLHYGKNLKSLPKEFQTPENKVRGCVSQVWVRASIDNEKKVYFEAESDSLLTKGLAALLVEGLSGSPASEILQIPPDFIQMLGLNQSLTPSRSNGFLNMLKLMQKKAIELSMASEGLSISTESGSGKQGLGLDDSNSIQSGKTETAAYGESETVESSNFRTRQQSIREKLETALDPVVLEIDDVSYQHAGHAGVQKGASETHFNLKIVSPKFEGRTLVKRHRLVYDLLQDELQNGLHALSIVAKTPSEAERV